MNDDNHTSTAERYVAAFKEHGDSAKSMLWNSYKSMVTRYKQLVIDLDVDNKSILDAGCGMGDLLPFLYSRGDNFEYLGADSNPNFINTAQKRYPGENFKVRDPFVSPAGEFDIVIACGVMNSNVPNWLELRKKMITSLFEQTKETLVFNMAGSANPQQSNGHVAYANTKDVVDFCKSLTPNVTLRTGYHPKDFTIVMKKLG